MENLKDLGGLKMTLKVSWLKRIIIQTQGWAEFPNHFKINNIILYGNLYPTRIVESIYNRFWKDMVNSVIRLTNTLKIRNITHLHLMPLWYNSELQTTLEK